MASDNRKPARAVRVEFWRDDGGDVIDAETFISDFAAHHYSTQGAPLPRILPLDEYLKRSSALVDGDPFDPDVAATQRAEDIRRALEKAVLAETKTPRFSDGAKMRDGMPLRWPFDPFVRVFFARAEFIAFMRDEALIEEGQVANGPLQPDAADTSLLLGPAFAKRKGNQAPGPWTPEQLAELMAAHQLLQAQGVRNPTTTLARELGVSATTIAKHLVDARAKANEAKPGGANVRWVKGGGRQT